MKADFGPDGAMVGGMGRPFNILVVDDSALQRRILRAMLTKRGYQVTEADCGAAALRLCAEAPFDFILSDWMMPGMDGLEFCRQYRRMQGDHYGYFVLLTSRNEQGTVAEGLNCGADDFLNKPVNIEELESRLQAGARILTMQSQLRDKNAQLGAALTELQALYQAQEQELTEARQLQQSLVPERFRDFGAGQIALMLRPSGHVGGDLVGFVPAGPDEVLMYAIDVSGHGISSALMTARLAAYLSPGHLGSNVAFQKTAQGYQVCPLDLAVARLNERLLNEIRTDHYATMVLAKLHLRTGRLSLCQAGHPHPIVLRAGGQVEFLGQGGMPVGLISGAQYETVETTLTPGDRLWILSDGISESTDRSGEMLGDQQTGALLGDLAAHPANTALDALMWHLSAHSGTEEFEDDISAILWQVAGSQIAQNPQDIGAVAGVGHQIGGSG